MSQTKALLSRTIIYAVGNFGTKILSVALVSLFSFYLTPSEFGFYDVMMVVISFLVPFTTLQAGDAVYRFLLEKKAAEPSAADRIKASVISNGIAITVMAFLLFSLGYIVFSFFSEMPYKALFIVLLCFSGLTPFTQQIVRGLGFNKLYAFSGILLSLLLVLFSCLFLVSGYIKGIKGLLAAGVLSHLIVLPVIISSSGVYKYCTYTAVNKQEIKKILKYSAPLIPNSISWLATNVANKFIILWWLGTSANGIFGVSTKYPGLIYMINSIFILAVQDIALEENKESRNGSKTFMTFLKFEFSVIFILIILSPFIGKYLLSSEYEDSWKYMPALFIGNAFSAFSAYWGAYYLKEKNTKGIFLTTVWGAVVNIGFSFALMPFIGLHAAAIGSLISFILVYLLRYRYLSRSGIATVNNAQLLIFTLTAIAFSAVSYINITLVTLGACLISILLFGILNRKLLQFVTLSIRTRIKK